jgi:hypothetical protein
MDLDLIPLDESILHILLRDDCLHRAYGFGPLFVSHTLDIWKLALPLRTAELLVKHLAHYVNYAHLGDDEGVAIFTGVEVAGMCCQNHLRTTQKGKIVNASYRNLAPLRLPSSRREKVVHRKYQSLEIVPGCATPF